MRLQAWQVAAITLLDDRFIEVANSPILPPPSADNGAALIGAFKRHVAKRKKKK